MAAPGQVKGSRNYRSRPHDEYVKDGKWWYQNTAYVGPKKGSGGAPGSTSNKGLAKAPTLKRAGSSLTPPVAGDPAVTYTLDKLGKKYGLEDWEVEDAVESVMADSILSPAPVSGMADSSEGLHLPASRRKEGDPAYTLLHGDRARDRDLAEEEKQAIHVYREILGRSRHREAARDARSEFRSTLLKDTVAALREGYDRDGRKFRFSAEDDPLVWSGDTENGVASAGTLHVGMGGDIVMGALMMDSHGDDRDFWTSGGVEFPSPDGVGAAELEHDPDPFYMEGAGFWSRPVTSERGVGESFVHDNAAIIGANHYLALSKDPHWKGTDKSKVSLEQEPWEERKAQEHLGRAKELRKESFDCPPDKSYAEWMDAHSYRSTGILNPYSNALRGFDYLEPWFGGEDFPSKKVGGRKKRSAKNGSPGPYASRAKKGRK